jgi:hypothetical protein
VRKYHDLKIVFKYVNFQSKEKKKPATHLTIIRFFSISIQAILFDFISNLFQKTLEIIKLEKGKKQN